MEVIERHFRLARLTGFSRIAWTVIVLSYLSSTNFYVTAPQVGAYPELDFME